MRLPDRRLRSEHPSELHLPLCCPALSSFSLSPSNPLRWFHLWLAPSLEPFSHSLPQLTLLSSSPLSSGSSTSINQLDLLIHGHKSDSSPSGNSAYICRWGLRIPPSICHPIFLSSFPCFGSIRSLVSKPSSEKGGRVIAFERDNSSTIGAGLTTQLSKLRKRHILKFFPAS